MILQRLELTSPVRGRVGFMCRRRDAWRRMCGLCGTLAKTTQLAFNHEETSEHLTRDTLENNSS
jgi:hypothetical protein